MPVRWADPSLIPFKDVAAHMITVGSVSRDDAALAFPFLAKRFSGRRSALKEFTHRDPDFVFWIFPDGRLFDARDAHRTNVPRGYEHIVNDPPEYGGFLRGRIASDDEAQLLVVYCLPEALAAPGAKLQQLVRGMGFLPVPLSPKALVVSDNCDLYGTWDDVVARAVEPPEPTEPLETP